MPDLQIQIIEQNPWWETPELIEQDRHLQQFEGAPFHWEPPVMDMFTLNPGDVQTLRGPRQVGKTTALKRTLARQVRAGKKRVLYFSFDLMKKPEEIVNVIREAKKLHPEPEGPWHIFLDEITTIEDWARGVKYVRDQGLAADDYLMITGSSAQDLRKGAELLPGRRGEGGDLLMLPVSFRDFCKVTEKFTDLPEPFDLPVFLTEDGKKSCKKLRLQFEELNDAFSDYLRVGGFPAAITDYIIATGVSEPVSTNFIPGEVTPDSNRGNVDPESMEPRKLDCRVKPGNDRGAVSFVSDFTIRMVWDTIAGDITRANKNRETALKLLEVVSLTLKSPFKWSRAGEDLDIHPDTVKSYVRLLSETFALMTVYFWDLSGKTFRPVKDRKVYFIDPLFEAIPHTFLPGARRTDRAGWRENLTAIGLFRATADVLLQADPVPGAVHTWRSSSGREIDFMIRKDQNPVVVEVKGDNSTKIRNARRAIKQTFERGVIVTDTVINLEDSVPAVPVSMFLALLKENPVRLAEQSVS